MLELPWFGVNPLSSLERPSSSLLIEYHFVIAVTIYWSVDLHENDDAFLRSKIWKFPGEGHHPIPQWDRGGSPLDTAYPRFSIRPPTALDPPPPQLFLTIRAHAFYVNYVVSPAGPAHDVAPTVSLYGPYRISSGWVGRTRSTYFALAGLRSTVMLMSVSL